MVMFLKRPGGQSQFSAHLAAQMSTKSQIQQAQEFVLENLSADLSVDGLARRAGMSTRNFSRVFRRDVKLTPAAFVDAARIDAARRMLTDTKTPLQRIARACGFGNLTTMRRVFARNLGVAPLDYRKRFRSAYMQGRAGKAAQRRPQSEDTVEVNRPRSDRPAQSNGVYNKGARPLDLPERQSGGMGKSTAVTKIERV
jgi:AraC-like DNA-binding protein